MQTASFYQPPLAAKPTVQMGDTTRASVAHLLAGAVTTPCSTAAHAFVQIVPPLLRFQLALDVLMPMLDSPIEVSIVPTLRDHPVAPPREAIWAHADIPARSPSLQLTQRILVSYILYSLYAPHPIAINPFKSVLAATFNRERDAAVRVADAGGVSEAEQFIWVLWKILKGDGNDVSSCTDAALCVINVKHCGHPQIGPFSPSTLAKSPLPPKLRAANLSLESAAQFQSVGVTEIVDGEQGQREPKVSAQRDQETEVYSRAASLLLASRERVLSLAEHRVSVLNSCPQDLSSQFGFRWSCP